MTTFLRKIKEVVIFFENFKFFSKNLNLKKRPARSVGQKNEPKYLDKADSVVWELTDNNRNMIFNFDIVPVSTEEAQKFGEKHALGIETNIANYQRKQNTNNNYTSIIPYDMEQHRKEIREFLDDITSRDQKMFSITIH